MLRKLSQILVFPLGVLAVSVFVIPVSTLVFELPKLFVLSFVALCCAISLLVRKQRWFDLFVSSIPGLLYLLFVALILTSLLWSVAPLSSLLGTPPRFQGVLAYLCYFTLGIFAAVSVQTDIGQLRIVWAVILSNICVILYGLLQMLSLDPLAIFWNTEAFLGRIFSTIGHPNALGQFILLTVPFVVRSMVFSKDRTQKIAWTLLLILNVTVLFGTVSRSAILGAAIVCIFYLLCAMRYVKLRMHRINVRTTLVASFVIVLCLSIGLLFFSQRFSLNIERSRSIASRVIIWESTLTMIQDRPEGYGLEAMAFSMPRFLDKEIYNYESLHTTVDRAHNEFLQILVTLGPLGFIIYVSLVVILLLSALRYGKSSDTDGYLRAAAAGILGFQIAMLFGFPSMATGAIFWLLVGCIIGLILVRTHAYPQWLSQWGSIFFIVVSTITLVVSAQWTQSRFVHAYAASNPSEELLLRGQAIELFGYDRETLINTAEVALRALEGGTTEQSEQLISSIQDLITQLKLVTGKSDAMIFLLEGWLFAIQGNRDGVLASLALAKELLPESITYYRTEQHLFDVLGDEEGVTRARQNIKALLPSGYFEEGSELRRILKKQHSWLEDF